jgi:hypothetical protein
MLCIFIINIFILITAEKIAEVKRKTKNGYPVGELKNELITEGYTKEDIAKCFEVHKADMQSWYLFFGSVFFIVGIWLIIQYNNILVLVAGVILLLFYFKEVK